MELSGATLLASLVVSTIGFGLFLYGKKQLRFPQLIVGLVMMIYPYFVASPVATWGIGGALVLALVATVRLGM